MRVTAQEAMTDLICACLPELNEIEAALVRDLEGSGTQDCAVTFCKKV
jgi:hypothetical protein